MSATFWNSWKRAAQWRHGASLVALVSFLLAAAAPAEVRQVPVALMLKPAGATLIRAGSETAIAAKPGDLLFAGDAIRTSSDSASFLFCPGSVAPVLQSGSEVLLEEKQLTIKAGRVSEMRPVASCFLPPVQRLALASQQTYGAFVTRGPGEESAFKATPRDKWPSGLAEEMSSMDAALALDAADPAGLVARAVLFEKYNLPADALADYYRIVREWPEALWLSAKIIELQRIVTRNAILEANPGWR